MIFWGKSFKSCPSLEVSPPELDVTLVLFSLMNHPYEPLRKALDRDFTLIALFILALASAKIVGKLNGLLTQVRHSERWRSLSSFVSEFAAKTQKLSVLDDRFDGFLVPSL